MKELSDVRPYKLRLLGSREIRFRFSQTETVRLWARQPNMKQRTMKERFAESF